MTHSQEWLAAQLGAALRITIKNELGRYQLHGEGREQAHQARRLG